MVSTRPARDMVLKKQGQHPEKRYLRLTLVSASIPMYTNIEIHTCAHTYKMVGLQQKLGKEEWGARIRNRRTRASSESPNIT